MSHEVALALTSPLQLVSHQPGTRVSCSVMTPVGDGLRDISFILQGPAPGDMQRWYDTYDGLMDAEPDWYALSFPSPVDINAIVFMHGPMFPEGGWWTSLSVQYRDEQGLWCDIPDYSLSPAYDFRDARGSRQPYESYSASFTTRRTNGIRIIGQPGGPVRVTTMAYLAAGTATPEQVAQHLEHLRMPLPQIFQFIPPNKLWDLISSLRDATGVAFDLQSSEGLGLDHFLDEERFKQFHQQQEQLYDPRSLYHQIGMYEGWERFGNEIRQARAVAVDKLEPQLARHHGGMLWIAVPVVINAMALGTLENRNLIASSSLDLDWHRHMAQQIGLAWQDYQRALSEIPELAEGRVAGLMRLVQVIGDLSQQQIHQRLEVDELRVTVEELATPVMPVWDRVLAVPLVGRIDEERAQQLSTTVLRHISESRAGVIIFDVTGVQMLDSNVALYLSRLILAARLLGARSLLSGIRPEVADALISTGADLAGAETHPTLQAALAQAIMRSRQGGDAAEAWPRSKLIGPALS